MKHFLKGLCSFACFLLAAALVLGVVGVVLGGRPTDLTWYPFGSSGPALFRYDLGTLYNRWTDSDSTAASSQVSAHGGAGRADPAARGSNVPAGDITSLDIEIGAATVYISAGDGYSLQVDGSPAYTNKVENGTWKIETESWAGNRSNVTFTVTVPRDAALDEVELTIGAGTMYVEGLRCARADLEAGAGMLEVTGLCTTDGAHIETGLGTVTLEGELLGRTEIDCGMGSVEMALAGSGAYGYSVDCGMGSVEIGPNRYGGLSSQVTQNAGAENFFAIDCGMGSVSIRFQET